ncbi:MAG TPA: type II toxin-antitoxin system VapB family antitoxin [Thermoanaerobaculia bacterium]|nr:type II toxin-antitoxin system VapB family antitoxin [Thermoanaerobaculia bacterium]
MRLTIEIDDKLLKKAMRLAKAQTKRGLIEEALRTLIDSLPAEQKSRKYREGLRKIEPLLRQIKVSESPIDLLRSDRDR